MSFWPAAWPLTVRLGREVLALASLDENLHRWVRGALANMTSPKRREQADLWISRSNPMAAARALSPSELFLLGKAYFHSLHGKSHRAASVERGNPAAEGRAQMSEIGDVLSKAVCPVMDRLNEIVPEDGSADAQRFREEVEQYDILLRQRLGLAQLSFQNSDSYEGLERSVRKEILYERVCDLKIRMAELSYSLGLPASLGGLEAELALHDILPRSPVVRTSTWQSAIEQIELLGKENIRNWVNQLISRGSLIVLPASPVGADRNPQ